MLSGMVIEVDKPYSYTNGFKHSVAKRFGFANYGYDQPIMVFVVTVVQQWSIFCKSRPSLKLGTHSTILFI